jgi:hypothetical protein
MRVPKEGAHGGTMGSPVKERVIEAYLGKAAIA